MKKLGMLALVVALAASRRIRAVSIRGERAIRIASSCRSCRARRNRRSLRPRRASIRPRSSSAVDYAGKRNTTALVIGRSGHIVFEKYWGDTTLETQLSASRFAPVLDSIAGGFGDE